MNFFDRFLREAVKKYLADLSVKGVPPPHTPLTENHFAKKPLEERGGTPPLAERGVQPPPPLTENHQKEF